MQAAEMREAPDASGGELETTLTLAAVQRIFATLPDQQRVVILLVCVEGYTYKETAEILRIPIGTVMSRLARGRLTLCETLRCGASNDSRNVIPFGHRCRILRGSEQLHASELASLSIESDEGQAIIRDCTA